MTFETQVIVPVVVFCLTFAAIFSGKLHRTIASISGAVLMLVAGDLLEFYPHEEAVEAINFGTLELLLGMMIIVGFLRRKGFFEFISIRIAKKTGNRQFYLFLSLCGLTAISSAILDNVTTIVLVAPMTIAITEVLKVSPVPYLIGEAVTSIIGGMATLVGDPPNIIIGSAADLSFNQFLIHLGPVSLLTWSFSILVFYFLFKFEPIPADRVSSLQEMSTERAVEDWRSVKQIIGIIGMVIVLYLVHSYIGIDPGLVALIGAATALITLKPDIQEVLEDIEWDALAFLASLFVVVGGIEAVGTLDKVAEITSSLLSGHGFLAPIIILWVAGIFSAVVDNIPFTVAMIPIVAQLHGVMGGELSMVGLGYGGCSWRGCITGWIFSKRSRNVYKRKIKADNRRCRLDQNRASRGRHEFSARQSFPFTF